MISKCPVCGKAVDEKTKPFCSRRCADIDLGRWFGESYKMPAPPDDEETFPSPDAGKD